MPFLPSTPNQSLFLLHFIIYFVSSYLAPAVGEVLWFLQRREWPRRMCKDQILRGSLQLATYLLHPTLMMSPSQLHASFSPSTSPEALLTAFTQPQSASGALWDCLVPSGLLLEPSQECSHYYKASSVNTQLHQVWNFPFSLTPSASPSTHTIIFPQNELPRNCWNGQGGVGRFHPSPTLL